MDKTRKSLFWNIANSWWILLTFTFLFNGVAFLYIGTTVNNKRWVKYGVIYSIPFIFMIIAVFTNPEFGVIPTISMILLIVGELSSIIHAFVVRKEFLIRLEGQQYVREALIQKMRAEYMQDRDIPKLVQSDKSVPTTVFTRGPLTRQS